ncbi:NUDIX domain-containing protein [Chitinimonas lacunae]|uniref:NUDIX domain-containing protein n=1 Tax=Chitinimonas lacunae TaxID=1963018 RepID=A0ABV8MSZ8_9NEIS
MAYEDLFRLSAHAVITEANNRVLLLKARSGDRGWDLPGGALGPGETPDTALRRQCLSTLGLTVAIRHMTGVYYHSRHNSHAFIYRCELLQPESIRLGDEHSEWRFFAVEDLAEAQRRRVEECLSYEGVVASACW